MQFQFVVTVAGEAQPQATQPFQVDAAEWPRWADAEIPRGVTAVVQFTFVFDDGATLKEQVSEAVAVDAEEWTTFASDRLPALVHELEESLSTA